jgi:hypothetical protein
MFMEINTYKHGTERCGLSLQKLLCQASDNAHNYSKEPCGEDSANELQVSANHNWAEIMVYQAVQLVETFHVRRKSTTVLLRDFDLIKQESRLFSLLWRNRYASI